jgi:hypothetical protein
VAASAGLMLLRPAAARLLVLAALFVVALLAAGVPVGLLRPARWGALAHNVNGGLQPLGTTLWPYSGRDGWTRVDILLALVAVPMGAAALGFWPIASAHKAAATRYRIRQVLALVLLLGLYVVGVLDSSAGSITAEGLLLLALVVAWLWLPGLSRRRVTAALAWVAAAGAVGAVLAGQIGSRHAWLDYRAWDLVGAGHPSVSFSWDQSYGPITWSRSQQTVFTVAAPRPQLWKMTTLDRFDGLRFLRSGVDDGRSIVYQDLPLPLNQDWYAFATFTVEGLRSAALPSQQGATVGVRYSQPIEYELDGTTRTRGPAPAAGASCGRRREPSRLSTCMTSSSICPARASPACDWPPPTRCGRACSSPPARSAPRAPACLRLRPRASSGESSPRRTPACTGWRSDSPPAAIRATTSRWRSRTTSRPTTATVSSRRAGATRSRRFCSPTGLATASSSPARWR